MTNFELIKFADAESLALTAAHDWLRDAQAAQGRNERYCVALSGGRIGARFLSAVAELGRAGDHPLRGVHFFWGDERCVGPDDAESNFGMARERLFQPLGIPESQIHRIRGEAPPAAAAVDAATELRRFTPTGLGGQPILDLVLLGMGEEGHVASLFPGESEDLVASPVVFRPVLASKPPPRRITLGYPAIAAAEQVWVLVSGLGKEEALRSSLEPSGRTPLARVIRLRAQTRIFTDLI